MRIQARHTKIPTSPVTMIIFTSKRQALTAGMIMFMLTSTAAENFVRITGKEPAILRGQVLLLQEPNIN